MTKWSLTGCPDERSWAVTGVWRPTGADAAGTAATRKADTSSAANAAAPRDLVTEATSTILPQPLSAAGARSRRPVPTPAAHHRLAGDGPGGPTTMARPWAASRRYSRRMTSEASSPTSSTPSNSAIGMAVARFTGGPRLLVARDMRESGVELALAFAYGARSEGVAVTDPRPGLHRPARLRRRKPRRTRGHVDGEPRHTTRPGTTD